MFFFFWCETRREHQRERERGGQNGMGYGARALSVVWAAGVLYEYKGLCYPHKAWLFHAHTVAAAAVVVAAVWGTTHSQSGAKGTTVHERRRLLSRHRNYMQWAVGGSVLTAGTMLYKKAVQGDLGLLLVSGRMPSSHSWLALAWLGPVVLLLGISGLIVHRGAGSDDHRPHPLLETVSKAVFGSLGSARKALTPWHRNSGLIGTTVLLVAAAYGLTGKNDIHFRKQLAYCLPWSGAASSHKNSRRAATNTLTPPRGGGGGDSRALQDSLSRPDQLPLRSRFDTPVAGAFACISYGTVHTDFTQVW